MRLVMPILMLLPAVAGLVYNLRLNLIFGVQVWAGVYYAIFLGLVLIALFMSVPASRKVKVRQWYDYVLAILASLVCGYYAFTYETFIRTGGAHFALHDVILSVIAIVVVLEAVRRTTGWAMVYICIFFIIYALYADLFPSIMYGPRVPFGDCVRTLALSDQGLFGSILGVAATYVITFVTFGTLMVRMGIGDKFARLAVALAGRARGGAAKIAVVGSALLGTITGDPVANVGITGSVSIPLMKKSGFKPEFAGAVETVASVGGVITPPMMGAVVFVMAELSGIKYVTIMAAAAVPALLYYIALYYQIDFFAGKNGLGPIPAADIPDKKKAIVDNWATFLVFTALVVFIAVIKAEVLSAIYWTCAILVISSLVDRKGKIDFQGIIAGFKDATEQVVRIAPLLASAGIIMAAASMTGATLRLSERLVDVSGGSILVLGILTAAVIYVFGMGLSAVLSYVLLANLVVPAMIQLGVPPIAAHYFVVFMGVTTLFTPPYAIASSVAAGLAKASFYGTSWQAMKLAIVSYMVGITMLIDPVLLLYDVTALGLIYRVVLCIAASLLLAGALQGYFFNRNLSVIEAALLGLGGVLLFVPTASTDLWGAVFGGAGVAVWALRWAAARRHVSNSAPTVARSSMSEEL